jgi:predicted DNA repair protein MutK
MAAGLFALLDDVAVIAKLAASSIDDVAGAAGKAGIKAAGVVVDDTAVTPGYAMGFTPDRELPIVAKIAIGSLRNKFLFLLPGALLLSAFAPWAVTPVLMLGGAYLCFEAAEKVLEAVLPHAHETPEEEAEDLALSSAELEKQQVGGAIRTDLILSAEITAIALVSVADRPLGVQAAALAVVGLLITVGVYGVVALIVKLDDIGLHLAEKPSAFSRRLGGGLVHAMPHVLTFLSTVGVAAMLWVGGGIIVHGLHEVGLHGLPEFVEHLAAPAGRIPGVGAAAHWIVQAAASAVVGLGLGAVITGLVEGVKRMRRPKAA